MDIKTQLLTIIEDATLTKEQRDIIDAELNDLYGIIYVCRRQNLKLRAEVANQPLVRKTGPLPRYTGLDGYDYDFHWRVLYKEEQ